MSEAAMNESVIDLEQKLKKKLEAEMQSKFKMLEEKAVEGIKKRDDVISTLKSEKRKL
jgi:hypothetical protein